MGENLPAHTGTEKLAIMGKVEWTGRIIILDVESENMFERIMDLWVKLKERIVPRRLKLQLKINCSK